MAKGGSRPRLGSCRSGCSLLLSITSLSFHLCFSACLDLFRCHVIKDFCAWWHCSSEIRCFYFRVWVMELLNSWHTDVFWTWSVANVSSPRYAGPYTEIKVSKSRGGWIFSSICREQEYLLICSVAEEDRERICHVQGILGANSRQHIPVIINSCLFHSY